MVDPGRPRVKPGSYIGRNEYGAHCLVCGEHLSTEDDDWDECSVCGGEGFGDDDDGWEGDDA